MTRTTLVLTGAITALALPIAGADAHVTVQPKTATPGSYTVQNVRVPNETDDATTTKIAVQFPPGFASVSTQRVPGWSVKVTKEKLAVPIKTDDGEITEGVKQLTWTADDETAGIAPGGFQDFPVSVLVPGKVGETLTFKALQTYDDGEVVRWIGGPDSDAPAPQVKLVADPAAAAPGKATAASDPDDGDGDGLAVVALVVGGLGVLLGAAGLAAGRRRTA
jgi:uncharacterized protein YcnI